ncbi:hypothetical protein L341_2402 [Escherichia coli CE418]|nr:hypothetical protein L341_2402 [Escherichia coli CE418]
MALVTTSAPHIRQAFQNWFYEQAMETPKGLQVLCGSVQLSD